MIDDWIMPEHTIISGWPDAPPEWSTEIEYDDDAINACRKNRPSNCQTCPARARCDELVREEWIRHLQWKKWDRLNSPEEVE